MNSSTATDLFYFFIFSIIFKILKCFFAHFLFRSDVEVTATIEHGTYSIVCNLNFIPCRSVDLLHDSFKEIKHYRS